MSLEIRPRPGLSPIHLLRGLRRLAEPGLRRFVWVPLLINLGLYAAVLFIGIHYFAALVHWLLPTWLGFLSWLLWPLFALAFVAVLYFSFTMVANLIGSPFYGYLAERTMAKAGTSAASPSPQSFGGELLSGLATEFKRLRYFLSWAIPLLVLFLIPGINVLAPFLWLAFNAWFLAMEYLAYPLERRGIGFDEQRRLATAMRTELLGFGGAVLLGLAIPGLNILIPPAAVVGAALYVGEARPEKSHTESE